MPKNWPWHPLTSTHELAAIFERLDQIEGQIDEVEAELRAKAAALTPVEPPDL